LPRPKRNAPKHSHIVEERAKVFAEVAEERAKGLAEVDTRRAELVREVIAMHKHKEAQEGRVELNIGWYRFQTSVQAMRRVPHTFFDAYFSGRYAQDVCDDGSIFVDRDGEHFGHVLEYMRDGHVSVAEPGARPSVSLLRALKREFGFYCMELCAEAPVEPAQPEMVFVMGGYEDGGACVVTGELCVTGGNDQHDNEMTSVEKYSPSTDTWSAVATLPEGRFAHAAVTVGSVMYVLGGIVGEDEDATGSVIKFDSAQGTWSHVAPMPEERYAFAACFVGSDIFVFGGVNTI
jgi:hypothetical protein